VEHRCNEKHDSRLAHLHRTPLHPALPQPVLLKGWRAAGDPPVWKRVGDAKEERVLCGDFRVKHFNFYVRNDLLAFYFAEVKGAFRFFHYLLAFKQTANS